MKLLKKLALVAFLTTGLTACVSTQSLNQEAAQSYAEVKNQAKAQGAVDTSSTTARRIHTVFNKMKPYAERANTTGVPFAWEITVLKSDELNAWAMPGGKMAFYTGLVDKLQLSDDEIAVVMGHEMSHALQEHGKSDRTVTSITNIVGGIGSAVISATTGVDASDLVGLVADLGVNKPFSRSQETEADEKGLFLMAEAGYNPAKAPALWQKMSSATGGSGVSIFSTHPTNDDRQQNLERLLPEAIKVYQVNKK
ncbi:deoxyribonuclease HsdR [Haemophilus paracuniculus]|uniref:Deoxyribonuclease HsdR n=1 Tax=Haemophilus paracuniculus TaxID=734 RepID=A0A1T0AV27_9PAST|nr:M48 family metallopeptidase [Haemophilus paracuniculus]OOS00732.1 deoxyribonuclease HsdR [Haemophilus paracuniculus]